MVPASSGSSTPWPGVRPSTAASTTCMRSRPTPNSRATTCCRASWCRSPICSRATPERTRPPESRRLLLRLFPDLFLLLRRGFGGRHRGDGVLAREHSTDELERGRHALVHRRISPPVAPALDLAEQVLVAALGHQLAELFVRRAEAVAVLGAGVEVDLQALHVLG